MANNSLRDRANQTLIVESNRRDNNEKEIILEGYQQTLDSLVNVPLESKILNDSKNMKVVSKA